MFEINIQKIEAEFVTDFETKHKEVIELAKKEVYESSVYKELTEKHNAEIASLIDAFIAEKVNANEALAVYKKFINEKEIKEVE